MSNNSIAGVKKHKKIPFPGKKWGQAKARQLAVMLNREIIKLDRAELEALIKTCQTFTSSNCGWIEYGARESIISLAESQLSFITPISQQKKIKP